MTRRVFECVYQSRLATRAQVTLAIRGRNVDNDRYIARAIRKLFDHSYLAKVPTHPFEPEIYCVSGRCGKGRRAATLIFGDDSRIVHTVSRLGTAETAHGVTLTWLRVFARLGAEARNWSADLLDHQELTRLKLALIPDLAMLIDKLDGQRPRAFLLEYQAAPSVRRTTDEKLTRYPGLLPDFEQQLGVDRAWVVVVLDADDTIVDRLIGNLEQQSVVGTFFVGTRERVLSVEPAAFWTSPLFRFPGTPGLVSLFSVGKDRE